LIESHILDNDANRLFRLIHGDHCHLARINEDVSRGTLFLREPFALIQPDQLPALADRYDLDFYFLFDPALPS